MLVSSRLQILLLIKNRIVHGGLGLLIQESLTVGLLLRLLRLLSIGVIQHQLLLCEVSAASLAIDITTDESSATSRNFHKILCQFLLLGFNEHGLFLTYSSRVDIVCIYCGSSHRALTTFFHALAR